MKHRDLIHYSIKLKQGLFRNTDSYRLIEQKEQKGDYFTCDERDQVGTEVAHICQQFMTVLKEACPGLSYDDIFLCCLKALGIKRNTITFLMGSFSVEAVKQRKHRIKKKMSSAENSFLFDIIFSSCGNEE